MKHCKTCKSWPGVMPETGWNDGGEEGQFLPCERLSLNFSPLIDIVDGNGCRIPVYTSEHFGCVDHEEIS